MWRPLGASLMAAILAQASATAADFEDVRARCKQVPIITTAGKRIEQIAYDCGGMHFAGNEVLFDTRTLKEIAHFHQGDVDLDKRPAWSSDKDAGTGN